MKKRNFFIIITVIFIILQVPIFANQKKDNNDNILKKILQYSFVCMNTNNSIPKDITVKDLIISEIPFFNYGLEEADDSSDKEEEVDIQEDIEEDNIKEEVEKAYVQKPLNTKTNLKNYNDNKPLVLLYHTHATESYKDKTTKGTYRSRDANKNMLAVGREIKKVLKDEYGINTLQDTKLHDYPSYNAAYDNSLMSAEDYLKRYPSIQYVFDIHRDGLPSSNNNAKYNGNVGGMKVANVMMVLGMNHKNSKLNLKFANKIKHNFDKTYPNVLISIVQREEYRYNQWLSPNAALFEVGSNLNTLNEARNSGKLIGRVLGETIKKDLKNK